jgi:putative spermidine/putrescine transport system substrate-binding protein
MTLSRRTLLSAGVATATVLASGVRSAVAESPQLVVGTWGGDYGQLLSELVDKPLVAPQGVEVVQDVANADPRKTKLLVERQSRRGSMDVACLSDTDAYLVAQSGTFEQATVDKISRLNAVYPELKKASTVPHIYSAQVILYNSTKVTAGSLC